MTEEIQKTDKKPATLQTLLEGDEFKNKVAATLPKHLTPERFIRVAVAAMNRTPKLRQCTPASFFKSLVELSSYGLEPDGRMAHLIPYKDQCTLIIDYKGLAELAMRSGIIKRLHADVICENDEFEFDMGEVKKHKIDFRRVRGEPYAAYAIAETKDGAFFSQVMTKEEILGIRDKSQGYIASLKYGKDNPWTDNEGEMWKKTAFRRLSKWLPLSPEFKEAVNKEDEREFPEREIKPAEVQFEANPFEAAIEEGYTEEKSELLEEEADKQAEEDFFKAGVE